MTPEVSHNASPLAKLNRSHERVLFLRELPPRPDLVLMSLFGHMINRGWTWTDAAHRLFSGPPGKQPIIANKTRTKIGENGAFKLWLKVEAKIRDNPSITSPGMARQVIGEMRAQLDAEPPWLGGPKARRDRTVLEAAHALAARKGKVVLALGTRTLSDVTGGAITFDRVAEALHSLVARGWLRLVIPGGWGTEAVYRLLRPTPPDSGVQLATCPGGTTSEGSGVEERTLPRLHELLATDVFLNLGEPAAAIWRVLHPTRPVLQKDLPALTGLSLSTVRRYLPRLVKEGLVFRDSDGFTQVEVDLPALAEVMGVQGKAEANREKHKAQRAMWKLVRVTRQAIAREKHRTKTAARQAASEPLRARKATPKKHIPAPRVIPKKTRRGGAKHRQQPAQTRRRIGKAKEQAR